MDTLKSASDYVTNKASELTSGTSKEANKEVAKSSDASLSTRATAAKDAVSDKMDESSSSASAEVDKQKLTH